MSNDKTPLSREAAVQRIEELERENREVKAKFILLKLDYEALALKLTAAESVLAWRDIEKEKPREMEPLNVRLTQKVAVKIWFEGQWLYNYAQWDTCWNSWHGDSTAWTHWRPIEEEPQEAL